MEGHSTAEGYRLQFAAVPSRFTGIIHPLAQSESARVLQKEIFSLLNKGVICVIPNALCQSSFYSRYFLVPKGGGVQNRAIFALSWIYVFFRYHRKYRFRMLTHTSLL